MNELLKQILIIAIIGVLMAGLLYLIVQFLPMYTPEKKLSNDEKLAFDKAKQKCIALCTLYKDDLNYVNGPCLSDIYTFTAEGWACDVAHKTRTALDDLPENQCKTVIDGNVQKFIEINENCEFIKSN